MQPLTLDANRPEGRFCILGEGNDPRVARSDSRASDEPGTPAHRNLVKSARSIDTWSCELQNGRYKSDHSGPIGRVLLNRTTVDRFADCPLNRTTVVRLTFTSTKLPTDETASVSSDTNAVSQLSLLLVPGVGALGMSTGLCKPKGSESLI